MAVRAAGGLIRYDSHASWLMRHQKNRPWSATVGPRAIRFHTRRLVVIAARIGLRILPQILRWSSAATVIANARNRRLVGIRTTCHLRRHCDFVLARILLHGLWCRSMLIASGGCLGCSLGGLIRIALPRLGRDRRGKIPGDIETGTLIRRSIVGTSYSQRRRRRRTARHHGQGQNGCSNDHHFVKRSGHGNFSLGMHADADREIMRQVACGEHGHSTPTVPRARNPCALAS